MTLELIVEGIPRPQQRPRVFSKGGRTISWSPKTEWDAAVYAQALAKRPKTALAGPIRLSLIFFFPEKKTGNILDYRKTTRPDLDNLIKGVKDNLTKAGWWKDDSQVWHIRANKQYSRVPGVRVDVVEETDGNL